MAELRNAAMVENQREPPHRAGDRGREPVKHQQPPLGSEHSGDLGQEALTVDPIEDIEGDDQVEASRRDRKMEKIGSHSGGGRASGIREAPTRPMDAGEVDVDGVQPGTVLPVPVLKVPADELTGRTFPATNFKHLDEVTSGLQAEQLVQLFGQEVTFSEHDARSPLKQGS
jgi:hypothetical protein